MISGILKEIKHLEPVPVITTANPPELLVKIIHDELGWKQSYNMLIMLDNQRVSNISRISNGEVLVIGEHRRPVVTLAHLKKDSLELYKEIDAFLGQILKKAHENKGVPSYTAVREALDGLINAISFEKPLSCILTTYDDQIGTGIGKPFIVRGLDFIEQKTPTLSPHENEALNKTKERLIKKWSLK